MNSDQETRSFMDGRKYHQTNDLWCTPNEKAPTVWGQDCVFHNSLIICDSFGISCCFLEMIFGSNPE